MKAVLTYKVMEGSSPVEKTKLFDTEKSIKICNIRNHYDKIMQELYISKTGILFKLDIKKGTLEVPDQKKCKEWIGRENPDKYIEFFGRPEEA